jgi:hypothetical protein
MWVFPQIKMLKHKKEELILVEWFQCRLFMCHVTAQLQKRRQVNGLTTMLMLANHSSHVI